MKILGHAVIATFASTLALAMSHVAKAGKQ
jgi:hypothetical protein